jgi:hypothetical protein
MAKTVTPPSHLAKPLKPPGPRFLPERVCTAAQNELRQSEKRNVWGQPRPEVQSRFEPTRGRVKR